MVADHTNSELHASVVFTSSCVERSAPQAETRGAQKSSLGRSPKRSEDTDGGYWPEKRHLVESARISFAPSACRRLLLIGGTLFVTLLPSLGWRWKTDCRMSAAHAHPFPHRGFLPPLHSCRSRLPRFHQIDKMWVEELASGSYAQCCTAGTTFCWGVR